MPINFDANIGEAATRVRPERVILRLNKNVIAAVLIVSRAAICGGAVPTAAGIGKIILVEDRVVSGCSGTAAPADGEVAARPASNKTKATKNKGLRMVSPLDT
jgi:hypothetical protein